MYDVIEGLKEFFEDENSQAMFDAISNIVSQLGPDLAKVANIDFDTLNSLYNYVAFNKKKMEMMESKF